MSRPSISPIANNGTFKLKRCHSPDHVGVNNYKKQRLIQDFEKLSLKDGPHEMTQSTADNGGHIDGAELGVISLPNGIKKQIWKLRGDRRYYNEDYSDGKLIYEKVIQAIRNERLQVIRWCDPLQIAYRQWVKWIETKWPFSTHFHNDNKDNHNYDPNYNMFGCDSDIDMDA